MIVRYFRSLWMWSVCALLFLIWVPILAVIRLFDRDPLVRRTGRALRVFGRMLIGVHLPEFHFAGFEHLRGGPFVMVSNHQSFIDIPLVSYLPIDTKSMARANLFAVPWAGWALRLSREISIDRQDPRNAARAMLQCARVLRGGCSVIIFAEGTRSEDGELLPFADGPFQLAIREGVPVVPVVIDGTGRNLGKNATLFHPRQPLFLSVLPPVAVDGLTTKQASELRDRVHSLMALELTRMRETAPRQTGIPSIPPVPKPATREL